MVATSADLYFWVGYYIIVIFLHIVIHTQKGRGCFLTLPVASLAPNIGGFSVPFCKLDAVNPGLQPSGRRSHQSKACFHLCGFNL